MIVSYVVPSRPLFRKSRDVLLDCIVYQEMYLLCFVYLLTAALFSLITLFEWIVSLGTDYEEQQVEFLIFSTEYK